MTYVSFPGLGIEEFPLNRVAFPIGSFEVNWYGLIIGVGMLLAVLYAMHHAKIDRVKTDDVIDLALAVIICGVIGARLYYVIMKFDSYLVTEGTFFSNLKDTLFNILNIRGGGLAIYGGIIGGFFAGFAVAKKKHIRFPVIADIAGPSVIVGQIVGRWGNFINVEAFGGPTRLPWRMCSSVVASDFRAKGLVNAEEYQEVLNGTLGAHPTFLYESLWNAVGLILITVLYKKKKFHGQMFLIYVAWYGLGRMFIEGLRTDSLEIGPIRVSQLVGAVSFIAAVVLLILGFRRAKAKGNTTDDYKPMCAAAEEAAEVKDSAEAEKEEKEDKPEEEGEEKTDGKVD